MRDASDPNGNFVPYKYLVYSGGMTFFLIKWLSMPVKKCFKHLGLFHVYDNVVNLDVEIQKIKLLRMTSD